MPGRPLGDNVLHGNDLDALYEALFDAFLLDTGGEFLYSRDIQRSNTSAHSTQRLICSGFRCKRTEVITQVATKSGTTAAGATPTLVRFGLYLRRPDTVNYDLVASTPNDTTLFAAANTQYTKSFSTPYTKLRGEEYIAAWLVVSAAAMPTFIGTYASTVVLADGIRQPQRSGVIGAQLDLPTTFNVSAITGTSPSVSIDSILLP